MISYFAVETLWKHCEIRNHVQKLFHVSSPVETTLYCNRVFTSEWLFEISNVSSYLKSTVINRVSEKKNDNAVFDNIVLNNCVAH